MTRDGNFSPEEAATGQERTPGGSASTVDATDSDAAGRGKGRLGRQVAGAIVAAQLFSEHMLGTTGVANADAMQSGDLVGPRDPDYLAALKKIRSQDVVPATVIPRRSTVQISSATRTPGDQIRVPEPGFIKTRLGVNETNILPSQVGGFSPEVTTAIIPAQVTAEPPIAMEPKHPVGAVRIVPVFDRITAVPGSIRILPPGVDVNGLGKQTIRLGDILNDPPGHGQRGEILPPRGSRKGPAA